MANNTNLTSTNEELVAIVKIISNKNKDLQLETYHLNKTDASRATQGKRDPTLYPNYKKEGHHVPDACFELEKNKDKRPTGWKSWL